MPDPFSLATGVISLLANSYKFSKDMYELIDGIQSAPNHIRSISDDLKALYSTLGTLGSLLRDDRVSQNALIRALSVNLEDALKNCVRLFREVGLVINEYVGSDGTANVGTWKKTKWNFKEKEIEALRNHLATYKATCLMAVNTATYVRTLETNNLAHRIQEDTATSSQQTQNTLAFIIQRLEDMEARGSHRNILVQEDSGVHLGGQESEYNFRMRRFMIQTASVLSSSPRESMIEESLGRPGSPSMHTSLGYEDEAREEDSYSQSDDGTITQDLEKRKSGDISTTSKLLDGTLSKVSVVGGQNSQANVSPAAEHGDGLMKVPSIQYPKSRESLCAIPSLPIPTPIRPRSGLSILAKSIESTSNTPSSSLGSELASVSTATTAPAEFSQLEVPRTALRIHHELSRESVAAEKYASSLTRTRSVLPQILPCLDNNRNKLYRQGYFLKLDDQDTDGKTCSERKWTECFAQLIGTVLSTWDAADLDVATEVGSVKPAFINVTDALLTMSEFLPRAGESALKNVLTLSTAGKNRYFLHFKGLEPLIQWTAAIRLAMFEYANLQELYTAALFNMKMMGFDEIGLIKERTKVKHRQWVNIRFSAGTPWTRCWCVITPPGQKGYQKLQHGLMKRLSNALNLPSSDPSGSLEFYVSNETRYLKPFATITNASCAFAIYPELESLIDSSTLIKIHGMVHKCSSSTTPLLPADGFIWVMPELQTGTKGCDTMLQWLVLAWDTFGLYGRPYQLHSDTTDPQSLVFALPNSPRHSYLSISEVADLVKTDRSNDWTETQWRSNLKEAVSRRMNNNMLEL